MVPRPTTHTIPALPPGSPGYGDISDEAIEEILDEKDFVDLTDLGDYFLASLESVSGEFNKYFIPNYSGIYKEANSKHAYQFLKDVHVILSNYIAEYHSLYNEVRGHVYSKEAKQILQLKKSSKGVLTVLKIILQHAGFLTSTIMITSNKLFPQRIYCDITAHDTRSTMKLLWAAVVVVSFVEAVDRETFFKMTSFDVLEKKHDGQSLATYLKKPLK
ncbi:hypothetical protein GE061_017215, partial [Apolygus lucorum]